MNDKIASGKNNGIRLAVICASNMNRSMEGHDVLQREGYTVRSFGTGTAVRLPGPSKDKPNIYPFGTPYDDIYADLKEKDKNLYTHNGLLAMLDRNRRIKLAPEKFQLSQEVFDVIITCDERVFDAAYEGKFSIYLLWIHFNTICFFLIDLLNRSTRSTHPVHLINVDIVDTAQQAAIGGQLIRELVDSIVKLSDIDHELAGVIDAFVCRTEANVLHTLTFM